VTPFALSFSPPVQRQACTDLLLCTDAVDTFLPRAIPTVAPFYRMGRRWQQFVIQKDQRFLHGRRKQLLARLPQRCEPQEPPPQVGPLVERRLGPTPAVEPRRDLLHDRPPLPSLRHPTGDGPQPLACTWAQVRPDKQVPRREPLGALLCPTLFLARGLLGGRCARTPLGPWGLLGRQALPCTGHRTPEGFDDLLDDMERADWMRYRAPDSASRLRRER
jgi:hypothetical protein